MTSQWRDPRVWRCPHRPLRFGGPSGYVCNRPQCRRRALLIADIVASYEWPGNASIALQRNVVVLDAIAEVNHDRNRA